jgi:hypothetical protein
MIIGVGHYLGIRHDVRAALAMISTNSFLSVIDTVLFIRAAYHTLGRILFSCIPADMPHPKYTLSILVSFIYGLPVPQLHVRFTQLLANLLSSFMLTKMPWACVLVSAILLMMLVTFFHDICVCSVKGSVVLSRS